MRTWKWCDLTILAVQKELKKGKQETKEINRDQPGNTLFMKEQRIVPNRQMKAQEAILKLNKTPECTVQVHDGTVETLARKKE